MVVPQDDESNLTVDLVKEFESKPEHAMPTGQPPPMADSGSMAALATINLPLGDFLPKEVVTKIASSHSLKSDYQQSSAPSIQPILVEEKPAPSTEIKISQLSGSPGVKRGETVKRKNSVNSEESEEEDIEALKFDKEELKPKITQEHVDFLFMKQEEDLFDSIWDLKNDLKFEYISSKPQVRSLSHLNL